MASPERDVQVAARAAPDAAAAAGSRVDRILGQAAPGRRWWSRSTVLLLRRGRRAPGFDIDFLREFARRWLDDPGALAYLPVPADERIPMLQKGRADLIAAALTKDARAGREVDFQPDLLQGRPAPPGAGGLGGRRRVRSQGQESRGGRGLNQSRQHQD